MIKRVIFDLDNTLIIWKKEYDKALINALKKADCIYNKNLIYNINMALELYEDEVEIYSKETLINSINNYTQANLPTKLIDYWIEELSFCFEKPIPKVIETLEYLYNKYELVVLTNWFAITQIKRLEGANMLKYFKNVYCADQIPSKPNIESYYAAAEECLPSECVMIGDSIKRDIEIADQIGMKVIHCNFNGLETSNDYLTIKEFHEIKNIL